eukprot:COSAG02_NODE_8291_length_2630_cov_1.706835_2_plen_345_part_00
MKARLFADEAELQVQNETDQQQHEQAGDGTVEHWREKTLDIYLSPPGRHVQPGSASAVRIRQFNGKFRMMLRDYVDEGNFIICPQAELRVSLRVLRGLMRAGFTVCGLLEIHSEVLRHRTNGLTVSIDTLPQLGTRMMQMMHCDKAAVARAAEQLHCSPHSFVREGYDSFAMSNWKPGVHRAARTSWASSGAGTALDRLLSDALVPLARRCERVERACCISPSADDQVEHSFAATNPADVAQAQAAATGAAPQNLCGSVVAKAGSEAVASAEGLQVPTTVEQQLLAMERELKEAKERSARARIEADRWRVSAARWRMVVTVAVSVTAAVALTLFSRRRLLPRRV